MKSFLSLERSATFTCRKDGIERVYLVYEGEEFVNYELINEKETTEENGVKAELIINGYSEKIQFINKARQKLAYYSTAVLITEGKPEVWNIERNELFQRSETNENRYIHLCLKDVYYSIDWEALGISPIPFPIALRFNLDSGIIPTPSRESYITNENTKKLILDRIKQVANWMVSKYNETVKEFSTFTEAYPYLGQRNPTLHLLTASGEKHSYDINNILSYSNITLLSPKVKGVNLLNPSFYKTKSDDLFYEFLPVGYVDSTGRLRSYKGYGISYIRSHYFNDNKFPIIVQDGMKGNLREYLKEKYGKDSLFVRVNPEKRRLSPPKGNNYDYSCYTHILDLHLKKKEQWRNYVNEWVFVRNQIHEHFIDERKCDESKGYKDWIEKRKKEMQSKKKNNPYKGLNKQAGDVTLSYLKLGKRFSWQKAAYPIANLHKNRYLTVLIDNDNEDSKELAKKVVRMINIDRLSFATVGKKERLKIPKHFQFINFEQFMTRDCKPFMRLASAIVFDKVLEDYRKINRFKNGIFQNCLKSLANDYEKLDLYVKENLKFIGDDDVREYIIEAANTHNLYDMQLWDVYNRLKDNIKKYDFITTLAEPSSWNEEERKRYNKTINQMLLFRKLYYDDLPEDAHIVFSKKEEVTI